MNGDNAYNVLVLNLIQLGVPLAAFFLGIVIRKVAIPGKDSPSLHCQLLLGLPVFLVIVSPMLITLPEIVQRLPAYLVTIGIIMEHGMLVPETATRHLQALMQEKTPAMAPVQAQPTGD